MASNQIAKKKKKKKEKKKKEEKKEKKDKEKEREKTKAITISQEETTESLTSIPCSSAAPLVHVCWHGNSACPGTIDQRPTL